MTSFLIPLTMLSVHKIQLFKEILCYLRRKFFLAYETEFVLILAVLENSVCPWAETAHMGR